MSEPKSLQEAILHFSNPDNCIDYLAVRRWPDGKVTCPGCGSEKVSYNAKRRTWKCSRHHAKREFSIKVGSLCEDSAIGLDKWLTAMKRGIAGSYVSVEPFHLFRYLDEQVFRYNNRATKDNPLNDADRFDMAVRKLFGKRLTFDQLTGKLCETSAF